MTEHQLRAIKRQSAAVILLCAACTTAIVSGWPL